MAWLGTTGYSYLRGSRRRNGRVPYSRRTRTQLMSSSCSGSQASLISPGRVKGPKSIFPQRTQETPELERASKDVPYTVHLTATTLHVDAQTCLTLIKCLSSDLRNLESPLRIIDTFPSPWSGHTESLHAAVASRRLCNYCKKTRKSLDLKANGLTPKILPCAELTSDDRPAGV